MVSAKGKDPITKVNYRFSQLWNLYKYNIPTRDNMSRNPMGQLTISDWCTSDFLFTAETLEKAFGIYGRVINIEDEELDELVKLIHHFPEKVPRSCTGF